MEDELIIKLLKQIMSNQAQLNTILNSYTEYKSIFGENGSQEEQYMKKYGITIKRQSNQSWYTRKRINSKQYYISGRTQKEVITQLQKLLSIKPTKVIEYILTFENFYQTWLNVYKQEVKETTRKGYQQLYKYFTKDFLKLEINKITPVHCSDLIKKIPYIRQKQKFYEYLNDILDKAVRLKKAQSNPLLEVPKPKYEAPEQRALTETEKQALLTACQNHKCGDFYIVTLIQGLRRGECLALKPNDIDLENNLLRIDESINDNTTKTNVKNKSSKRIMPLFPEARNVLIKYMAQDPNKRIFNYGTHELFNALQQIVESSNIGHIKTRELRHTFMTTAGDKNIPEHILQSWVGHTKGSKVTKKVYTHVLDETSQKCAQMLYQ